MPQVRARLTKIDGTVEYFQGSQETLDLNSYGCVVEIIGPEDMRDIAMIALSESPTADIVAPPVQSDNVINSEIGILDTLLTVRSGQIQADAPRMARVSEPEEPYVNYRLFDAMEEEMRVRLERSRMVQAKLLNRR